MPAGIGNSTPSVSGVRERIMFDIEQSLGFGLVLQNFWNNANQKVVKYPFGMIK
jgi:hypothetical protein